MRDRYERTFAAGDQIVEMARIAISSDGRRHLAEALERRETPLAPLVVVSGWIGAAAPDLFVSLIGEPSVRNEAADAVLTLGRAAVMPLVASLATGERAGRLAAVDLLGRLGDRRAVPPLCDLLAGADAELVAAAAGALATLGDSRALDSLLPLFGHEHATVRQAAIAAVNAIGASTLEPHLRRRFDETDPHVRECAIRVAGYFGFESCTPGILAALDDPEENVRRAAIEQLPILNHPRASARLARALADETPGNRAAAAHAARAADDGSVDGQLVSALGDSEAWVRYFAALSLGERTCQPAAPVLTTLAEADPAPQVRIAAVQAIGRLDPDAAIPLAERLLSGDDPDIGGAALTAVAGAHSERADVLLERALQSPSVPLKRGAIGALAARRTVRAVDTLAWAARLTDVPGAPAAAIDALSSIAAEAGRVGRAAVLALVDVGVDPDRRSEAIDALARAGDTAVDPLAAVLSDSRAGARLTAVGALARMRHPRASAALSAALRDTDPAVRAEVVAGFGRLGTASAGHAVAALRDGDPDSTVRRKAAVVCRRYGWER
jgi:HEAT repeat protein